MSGASIERRCLWFICCPLRAGFSHFTVRLFGDLASRFKFEGGSGLVWKTIVSASDIVFSVSKTQTELTDTVKLVAEERESRRKVVTAEPP